MQFNYINRYDKRNNILVNDFALYMDMTFDKPCILSVLLKFLIFINYNSFSETFNIKERALIFIIQKIKNMIMTN